MSADGFTGAPPPGAREDWTIDQGWAAYTPEQAAYRKTLCPNL